MPYLSKRSKANLETCHKDLQLILSCAIELYDFSVICGHRNEELQNKAFRKGYSKVNWPMSRHNKKPSNAVDIAPYPIIWDDTNRFYELAGIIKTTVKYLKAKGMITHDIKWGGNFRDFKDLPHFELVKR